MKTNKLHDHWGVGAVVETTGTNELVRSSIQFKSLLGNREFAVDVICKSVIGKRDKSGKMRYRKHLITVALPHAHLAEILAEIKKGMAE